MEPPPVQEDPSTQAAQAQLAQAAVGLGHMHMQLTEQQAQQAQQAAQLQFEQQHTQQYVAAMAQTATQQAQQQWALEQQAAQQNAFIFGAQTAALAAGINPGATVFDPPGLASTVTGVQQPPVQHYSISTPPTTTPARLL